MTTTEKAIDAIRKAREEYETILDRAAKAAYEAALEVPK